MPVDSEVGDALLGGRLGATQPALEDLAGESAAAQAEGQRERQHHSAERDAESDQHHLFADAQMRQRGGGGEQQHGPVHGAGQQVRRMSVPAKSGGTKATSRAVAPGAPGRARPSTPALAKSRKIAQKQT